MTNYYGRGILKATQWAVDCGLCSEEMLLDEGRGAQFRQCQAREWGWRRTTRYGWICPRCAAKGFANDTSPPGQTYNVSN